MTTTPTSTRHPADAVRHFSESGQIHTAAKAFALKPKEILQIFIRVIPPPPPKAAQG